MQEYAGTVKSADVALQLETHLSAKKQFEVGLVNFIRNMNVSFPKYFLHRVFLFPDDRSEKNLSTLR